MLIYALIIAAAGLGTLYKAFREQRSLDVATTASGQDPRKVMSRMRQRYQETVTPWWVFGWVFSGVGVVLVVLSLL